MKIFKQSFAIISILIVITLPAQEILTGLEYNEVLKKKAIVAPENFERATQEKVVLQLPFFDDFKNINGYPDPEYWKDRNVFVNKDFPYFAPNLGAATFDAIDSTGAVYEDALIIPFVADYLTSNTIRLDSVFNPITKALHPADSLYLSFYYQPQGFGDEPEPGDSLLLEFSYLTGDTIFSHIDSVLISANFYLENEQDTLKPFDTLYAPPGCDTTIFMINFQTLIWGNWLMLPCDSVFVPEVGWKSQWKSEGMRLTEFQERYGTDWVQIMIPVKDSIYFYKDFSFRFRNYASIANDINPSFKSNVDQWNIDYVYMNYNRTIADTTYRVLTFSNRAPSFLKTYQVMPYRQYRADAPLNTMRPELEMYISNLDKVERNTKYKYTVQQVNGNFGYTYNGGSCNLPPYYEFGFQNCNTPCGSAHACPPVLSAFNFDYSRDTTSYIIKHYISDSSESNIIVDSASYTQGFYNYYAYDDGTPEFGYGLEPAGAQLAYKFTLSMPDTLYGIQMYFNQTLNFSNNQYFNINIWQDNNGKPGEIIAQIQDQQAMWEGELYEFYPYMLEEPIILSGTFYVGWQQFESSNLNIGFDANNANNDKIFYKIEQTWYNSNFAGSLLIRPMFGPNMVVGNEEFSIQRQDRMGLYPNPSNSYFKIDNEAIRSDNRAQLSVFNIFGSLVKQQTGLVQEIDISHLASGMYIVRVTSNGKIYNEKLLINR